MTLREKIHLADALETVAEWWRKKDQLLIAAQMLTEADKLWEEIRSDK